MFRERFLITSKDLNLIKEDVDSIRTMVQFIKQAKSDASRVEDYCERTNKVIEHLRQLLVVSDFE